AKAGERNGGPGEEGEDRGAETVFTQRVADVVFERREAEDRTGRLDLMELHANGIGQRHRVALRADEEPRRWHGGADAGVDGGRRRRIDAILARIADDAANHRAGHHRVLRHSAEVAAEGRDLTQIAVGKAAVDKHGGRATVVLIAILSLKQRNAERLEVAGGDDVGDGDDLMALVPFAFGETQLNLRLAGHAGELPSPGACALDAGDGADGIEVMVDALGEALHVDGFAPAGADLEGEDVGGIEAGRDAAERLEGAEGGSGADE